MSEDETGLPRFAHGPGLPGRHGGRLDPLAVAGVRCRPIGPAIRACSPACWRYWTRQPQTIRLHFSRPTEVAVGDSIFVDEAGPEHPIMLRRVGEIRALLGDDKLLLPTAQAKVSDVRADLLFGSAGSPGCGSRIAPSRNRWLGS